MTFSTDTIRKELRRLVDTALAEEFAQANAYEKPAPMKTRTPQPDYFTKTTPRDGLMKEAYDTWIQTNPQHGYADTFYAGWLACRAHVRKVFD